MTKIAHRIPDVTRMPEAPQLSEVPRMPTSSYAPGGTTDDPVRLAGITIKAVDKIGDVAAKGIEDTATSIEMEAKMVGDKLRDLATAVRGHTVVANTHVSEFCERVNSVIDGIRDMEAKLSGGMIAQAVAAMDDGAPIPKFLAVGPAVNGVEIQ